MVQSGLPFSPKSSQSSLLFPVQDFGEAGQSPQVQPGEDDSLSLAELSSSGVALRLSASGFPGAVAAVAPSTTQTLFKSIEMNTKMVRMAICAAIQETCLWSLKCEDQRMPAALAQSVFFKTVC